MQTNKGLNQQSRAGSYMTFSTGLAHYALPVGVIRYITSMNSIQLRPTPDKQGGRHRVFDFEGHAIALYRFSDLMGVQSLVEESRQLIELLRQRRQDHVEWVEDLEHSILTGEPFTKATNPHQCAFGLWYDKYQPLDTELKSIMAKFDQPHRRIHSLAQQLIGLSVAEGRVDEAIAILDEERFSTLKTLMNLFDQAESRLQYMVKPVAMIVDVGNQLYALELDNLEDIHEFRDEHWLEQVQQNKDKKQCYDGFFQRGDGHLFIKLDPCELLAVRLSES